MRPAAADTSVVAPIPRAGADAYLRLLGKTLTRFPLDASDRLLLAAGLPLSRLLLRQIRRWAIAGLYRHEAGFDLQARAVGLDWPEDAETMIGLARLANLEACISDVVRREVPGDLVETGVWRGGAAIFMRAVLKVRDAARRQVWLADSFRGLPPPDPAHYPADKGDVLWKYRELAVPQSMVKLNFARYGLLDNRVRFLAGWFRDTLPGSPIDRIAVLRLDGDMYESTLVALESLYPRVSPGGYVIIDDYGAIDACRQATDEFRAGYRVRAPLRRIDWTGVYWKVDVTA